MRSNEVAAMPRPVLTLRGEFGDGLAELVEGKLAAVARHAHLPVLGIRVELHRHHDPAVNRPVVATGTVDLNGRHLHAEADARSAREAVDLLVAKLVRQVGEWPRTPGARRGH